MPKFTLALLSINRRQCIIIFSNLILPKITITIYSYLNAKSKRNSVDATQSSILQTTEVFELLDESKVNHSWMAALSLMALTKNLMLGRQMMSN